MISMTQRKINVIFNGMKHERLLYRGNPSKICDQLSIKFGQDIKISDLNRLDRGRDLEIKIDKKLRAML